MNCNTYKKIFFVKLAKLHKCHWNIQHTMTSVDGYDTRFVTQMTGELFMHIISSIKLAYCII